MRGWVGAMVRAVVAAVRDVHHERRRGRDRRRRHAAVFVTACSAPSVTPHREHFRRPVLVPVTAAEFEAARPGLRLVWRADGPEVVIADVPLPDGTVGALVATPTTTGATLRIDRGRRS